MSNGNVSCTFVKEFKLVSNGNVSCTFVKEFKYLNLVLVKIAYTKFILFYFIIILFLVENELMVIWNQLPKLHQIRSNCYNNNNYILKQRI